MVRPKKFLGQHFLEDENIAIKIVETLESDKDMPVLEIGPGMGVLTRHLLPRFSNFKALEIDRQSIDYLKKEYPAFSDSFIPGDFLRLDLTKYSDNKLAIIGNFPYNISSQIFFKILDHRDVVETVVCMLQREVANRIAAPPGNRTYGILSVFLQAFYNIEKVFDVPPEVFRPPPKVFSSVIRLIRNDRRALECDEKHFRTIVKAGFQMRRKTLRNALKGLNLPAGVVSLDLLNKRAEELSVSDFQYLTQLIEQHG